MCSMTTGLMSTLAMRPVWPSATMSATHGLEAACLSTPERYAGARGALLPRPLGRAADLEPAGTRLFPQPTCSTSAARGTYWRTMCLSTGNDAYL